MKESEAQQPNLMGNLRGSLLLGKASHSKPNVSLIPPGQKLSDGEKGRRREVAIRMLEQLKTQQKLADSDPAVAYIKGKIYGPKVLGFKLQDENDLVRYVAELQSLDQRTDTDLYRAKANQLIAYLKANEYNLKAVISEGKFRASPETFKIWEIYFSAPRSSTILAAFSNEVWQCLPMLVRPLLALTSEEQRRAELKSEFPLDATDSAILASLVGDYEHAIQQEHGMSHECYTVLAPVLNGDLPTAIKIAESWSDESNKNLSYALIVDQLLDEGRTQEAIQLFSRIDRSKNYGTMIGQVPLRMFNFHFYGSMPGLNLWTYLAGRIGDETIVDIDFLIGLVSDL